jgi:tetratricopeptide (TPR) repeat protein
MRAVADFSRTDLVQVLVELGRLHDVFGEWALAEETLACAVQVADALDGDDAVEVKARALAQLGRAQAVLCRYEAAERTQRRARELASSRLVRCDVLLASASLDGELGRLAEALEAVEQAHALSETAPAGFERDAALAGVLFARATILCALGRFDEADAKFRHAVERAQVVFGERSVELAHALNGLGMNCKYCGRFDEAEPLYRRAIGIIVAATGTEVHPDIASLYHNLGGLEHARDNYVAAEPHARRSVTLRRATVPDHPAVALDEAALAAILDGLGQRQEAEVLLRSALGTLERAPAAHLHERAVALNNLAALRYRLGDLDEAEALYRRALAIKRELIGGDAPEIASTLNNLAMVLRKRGATEEALAMYAEALRLFRRGLQPTHPSIAKCVRSYARLLRATGREDQATLLEAEIAATAQA